MKVYRFLRWEELWQRSLKDKDEGALLQRFGVMSPSYRFFKDSFVPMNSKSNTFGVETEITKYFFASLLDTLCVATTFDINNIIIEIDVPKELLKKYIGLGLYADYRLQVEYRLPYKDLYDVVALTPNDSFYKAISFFNAHFKDPQKERFEEYQELEKLLQDYPFNHIQAEGINSIYPLFCFQPKTVDSFFISDNRSMFYYTHELQKERERKYGLNDTLCEISKASLELPTLKDGEKSEELFAATYPLIEEENKEMRRLLQKR